MKSCIFYTLLLPLLYALLWYQGEQLIPAYMGPAAFLLSTVLPSLVCCIGWLWIQRRPIRSDETPYICFILPLGVMLLVSDVYIQLIGYDGIDSIFGVIIVLLANAVCCAGLLALTWLLRILWRIFSDPAQWKGGV